MTSGAAGEPELRRHRGRWRRGKERPGQDSGKHPLPAPGTWVAYDAASQMVHILGLASPGVTSAPDRAPWTVYVVEPHGNAVFADARLPDGFMPRAWAHRLRSRLPLDRPPAAPRLRRRRRRWPRSTLGSHAFAWRLPGVIAGAITAALLYLLTRILFRRRLVAALVGLFVLVDGMFFVQSRIGMNDVYVGLFIIAAYTRLRGDLDGLVEGPGGVLAGDADRSASCSDSPSPASGSPRTRSARSLLLILVRSALGRVLAILGLIGDHRRARLHGDQRARDGPAGFGNLTFLFIMVALTLLAVVVAVLHPIAWTDEEMRFAVIAPAALGDLVFFGALATGRISKAIALGSLVGDAVAARDRPRRSGRWSSSACSGWADGSGSGRWPPRRRPTTRSGCSTRPARPPTAGSGPAGPRASRSSGRSSASSHSRSASTS